MALWILLLIAIIIVFVLVHAVLLPKIFLKVNYEYDTLPDRGVKVVGEINGKSIIYEPDVRIRKFVKQYIVSERNGRKFSVRERAYQGQGLHPYMRTFRQDGLRNRRFELREQHGVQLPRVEKGRYARGGAFSRFRNPCGGGVHSRH